MITADKTRFDVCVVGGAGHVGLPLAIVFANKGLDVLINDVSEATMEQIARGEVPFMEHGASPLLAQALREKRLSFSSNPADVRKASNIVITIGTPVDEFQNPVLKLIRECVDTLIPHLVNDALVVLRSTVYPGTTNWLDNYLHSKGKNVKVAFCPERVVQGFAIEELQKLPQLISGTTPQAEEEANRLFSLIAPRVVRLTPTEAEFAKLFNNAYRYIQFAAANQFYMLAHSAGVNYHRVLAGMKTDYARAKDIPGPGFAAGPCLFKDTMQLLAFSDNQFSLGSAAMMVNEGMVMYLVTRIEGKYPLAEMTVGLLGMAFKAESDDVRSSLSYKLKRILEFRARAVLTTDPYVTADKSLMPLKSVIEASDLLILCAPHKVYHELETSGKPIVDIWGVLSEQPSDGLC